MKKFTKIFGAVCMMGLLTFVSTSCKKDKEDGEMTINVTIPDFETVGDRAYINLNGIFWWHENDFIRVYNLSDEANAVESTTAIYFKIGNQSTQTARFRGPYLGAKKAEGFRLFYPIEMVNGTMEEAEVNLCNENRQTFTVADHQQFHYYEAPGHHMSMVDPSAMPMVTQVNKLSDNARMHHLFGVASFYLNAAEGTTVVVDSIKLVDHFFNLTGDVSLKLNRFHFDDYLNAWDQFTYYQGITPEYQQNVLNPLYEYWGYDVNNVGHQITLNCMYEQDDEVKGVTLSTSNTYTMFAFMLRPLALCEGFNLTVYVHDGDPIELTDEDFEYGSNGANYTWAVRPGRRKTYIKSFPINY